MSDAPSPTGDAPPRSAWRSWARSAFPRRSWSLRHRVTTLLVTVSVVLVASVLTITLNALQARESMMRQVEELSPARVAVQQMMSAHLTEEAAVRSYILTRDPNFLASYEEGKTAQSESMERLSKIAAEDEELDANLAAVAEASQAWTTEFAEPAIEKVRSGEDLNEDDYREGNERFAELRSASQDAEERIIAETRDARERLSEATQQLIALLVLVGIVVVVLSVFMWVMLQHWVLRPLDDLGRHLQQVSEGNYEHRISVVGPPEVERVGESVDSMRERIVTELGQVAFARRRLQEQSELLERQTAELRRSNMELEQFAYVASHDLQEPLRKVASFCQLLQRRYQDQLDERANSYIDFAVEGAKRMQTLISDLLAFSRVGRTKNFGPVSLDTAFENAMNSLASAREDADATVTADELPTVHGDETLLTQVLFNLIGNAFKFRGDEPARVHISVEDGGEEWVFCCADNGIGIDPQYAERVFVIFQRLHTREKYGGTGIGLAMCKKIVEFHGGRIWLGSGEEEPGTRICWSLPKEDTTTASGASTEGVETRPEEV